ncbi:site-specific recombinase XerD [Streptomyces sp. Ag109_G2-6]|nr:site-specific recombinase XerD [Streptomyces sp. Ag109_G2-6]
MKGTTYKRCKCRARFNAVGRKLACTKKHGTWSYVVDLPLTDAGRQEHGRQQLTRGGFATQREATDELHQAIRLLAIPETDDDAGRLDILATIREHYRSFQRLPDFAETKRRFGAGLSLSLRQSVGEWLDEWLRAKRKLAANTRRSYAGHIEQRLKPYLGDIDLEKLRASHIRSAYDAIVATTAETPRPVGPATLARIHATLRAALNAAKRQHRIVDNPALFVEIDAAPRPKPVLWTEQRVIEWLATGRRPKVAVWRPEQIGAFLDLVAADRLYAYYHLLVFRGLRRGEGIGLPWTDVDLEAGALAVEWQIIQVGWATAVTRPKDDSGGVVALDSVTVDILRAHRARQAAERLALGPAWSDTVHVFTTEDGKPLHPDYVSRHFVRLVQRANTLRVGDIGQAVADVQRALGFTESGIFDDDLRRAVFDFQREHGLTANGIVDPHTWYLLTPDEPLRPYPHPGYLPPIRLHDLRHGAATLALAAGGDMKVISAMLRHSTIQITADTYTSVLPEVARENAEASVALVPQPQPVRAGGGAVSPSLAPRLRNAKGRSPRRENGLVRRLPRCAPPGTRTPDPLIKSQLL